MTSNQLPANSVQPAVVPITHLAAPAARTGDQTSPNRRANGEAGLFGQILGGAVAVMQPQQQAAGMVDFPANQGAGLQQQAAVVPDAGPLVRWLPMHVGSMDQKILNDPEMRRKLIEMVENLTYEEPNRPDNVPARTILLRFLRARPISEQEVREFFDSTFGDMVERMYMPEVPPEEGPFLYAAVVARTVWEANAVVGFGSSKYNINGKPCKAKKLPRKKQAS